MKKLLSLENSLCKAMFDIFIKFITAAAIAVANNRLVAVNSRAWINFEAIYAKS